MRCPLKEIHGLPEEDMLPPFPLSILGDVVHEVMREVRVVGTKHEQSTTEFVEDLFERKIRLKEERLSVDPRAKRLVPYAERWGKPNTGTAEHS